MSTTPQESGPIAGPGPAPTPSIGELFSRMAEQTTRLVRAEIDLAKAELARKAKDAGVGIGLLAAAGMIGFWAIAVLIAVLVLALCEAFAPWLAALIVFVVLLAIIGLLAGIGVKMLKKGTPPTPQKAIDGLKKDKETVTTAIQEGLHR